MPSSTYGPARALSSWTTTFSQRLLVPLLLISVGALAPGAALACACGCGVFDIGMGAMFPDGPGGTVYAEADFMDQNRNWSGTSSSPADANEDRRIRTLFYTLGGQYLFNRSWGVSVDLPYWDRRFTTTDENGAAVTFQHAAVGDVRIRGIYTGFSADLSTGLTFGLKLPTGDSTYANFDPDTEIGTGSTDLLLGAYHLGRLTEDGRWGYFLRGQWQQPLASKAVYRPGAELVGVLGTYFGGWTLGPSSRITPVMQLTAAYRGHDGGTLGHPDMSGYTRLIVQPGVELSIDRVRFYAEAGYAVHNNMVGQQLVARELYKLSVSYAF